MREITVAEFIAGYEAGLITEVVFIGGATNRVYGRSAAGQAGNPVGYEVVWAKVP